MKKSIFFLALIIGLSANAQRPMGYGAKDTVIVNSDTVIINIDAIVINPVIVNVKGDTAFSLLWQAQNVSRDTTQGCGTYVQLFDKYGRQIADFNQYIPASVVNQWGTSPAPIDDFILAQNPRFKRYYPKK